MFPKNQLENRLVSTKSGNVNGNDYKIIVNESQTETKFQVVTVFGTETDVQTFDTQAEADDYATANQKRILDTLDMGTVFDNVKKQTDFTAAVNELGSQVVETSKNSKTLVEMFNEHSQKGQEMCQNHAENTSKHIDDLLKFQAKRDQKNGQFVRVVGNRNDRLNEELAKNDYLGEYIEGCARNWDQVGKEQDMLVKQHAEVQKQLLAASSDRRDVQHRALMDNSVKAVAAIEDKTVKMKKLGDTFEQAIYDQERQSAEFLEQLRMQRLQREAEEREVLRIQREEELRRARRPNMVSRFTAAIAHTVFDRILPPQPVVQQQPPPYQASQPPYQAAPRLQYPENYNHDQGNRQGPNYTDTSPMGAPMRYHHN